MGDHQRTPSQRLVAEYANAVGRYGPQSDQVKQFRAAHADDKELLEHADALDRIKRYFGGSGIDWPAKGDAS